MLPMALAVSFSRVYNGVHYPSDVLVGAILGAGYAAAGAIALQAAWRWAGKKWFPLWHRTIALALKCRMQNAECRNTKFSGSRHPTPDNSDTHWLRLGYIAIFVMLIARWLYIASGTIDLEKDEAYQWLWSKHLALSYYSKPPGIALIQFTEHVAVGRHGLRHPVLFAVVRRDSERDGAALLRPRSQRAGGILAAAHRHRHAAAGHRHDFDDD